MSTTNLTLEGKQRLLLTRDELYDNYLEARFRLDTWQAEKRQLLSFNPGTNAKDTARGRREMIELLTRHMDEISEQLRTIDTLISPPHENTASH